MYFVPESRSTKHSGTVEDGQLMCIKGKEEIIQLKKLDK